MDKQDKNLSSNVSRIFDAELTEAEFKKLSAFIQSNYGIKMPPEKKIMLQSRLQKRLRTLEMNSYAEYIDYVFGKTGNQEIIMMMDVVSTNKTDFFREPGHFAFLVDKVLPEYYKNNKSKLFKVWSAGCSSGEEPYTLAMVLSEFATQNPGFDYMIFGTDLSTHVLQKAKAAIYEDKRVEVVPMEYKRKYLLKSKDSDKHLVRIVPELRRRLKLKRLNFMDNDYAVTETFDVIFCRNVLIYFDRQNQENVITKLCRNLHPDGFFFLGHSESIAGINVPLKHIQPTVYRKSQTNVTHE